MSTSNLDRISESDRFSFSQFSESMVSNFEMSAADTKSTSPPKRKVGSRRPETIQEEAKPETPPSQKKMTPSTFSSLCTSIGTVFSICSYHNVDGQVVPVSRDSDNLSGSGLNITNRLTEIIGGSKSRDLLDFTANIQIEFVMNQGTSALSIVRYFIDTESPGGFHKGSPFRKFLCRIVEDPSNRPRSRMGVDEVGMLLQLINMVTALIDNIRKMEEGFISSSSKSPGGTTLVSLEGCLALTDISLLASYLYFDSNPNLTSNSLDRVVQAIDSLFIKCHSLDPLFESNPEITIKLLFSQTVTRSSIVIYMLCTQAVYSKNNRQAKTIVQFTISLLQSLSPNLVLCRRLYEEASGQSSLLYWTCCDILINLVHKHKLGWSSARLESTINSDKMVQLSTKSSVSKPSHSLSRRSNYGTPHDPLQSVDLSKKVILVKSKSEVVQSTWSTRVRQVLQSSVLTPQEFVGTVSRLKNSITMKHSTLSIEASELEIIPLRSSDLNFGIDGNSMSRSRTNTYLDVSRTNSFLAGAQSQTLFGPVSLYKQHLSPLIPLTSIEISDTSLESFHQIKHTLIGFQYLMRATFVDSKELNLLITNVNEWLRAFADSFLCLLPAVPNGSNLNDRFVDDGYDKLLPFLVELWFHLTIGNEIQPHLDTFFWDLAKRFSSYVEMKQHTIRYSRNTSNNTGRTHLDTRRFTEGDDTRSPHGSYKRQSSRRPSTTSVSKASVPPSATKRVPSTKRLSTSNSVATSSRKSTLPKLSQSALKRSPVNAKRPSISSLRKTPSSSASTSNKLKRSISRRVKSSGRGVEGDGTNSSATLTPKKQGSVDSSFIDVVKENDSELEMNGSTKAFVPLISMESLISIQASQEDKFATQSSYSTLHTNRDTNRDWRSDSTFSPREMLTVRKSYSDGEETGRELQLPSPVDISTAQASPSTVPRLTMQNLTQDRAVKLPLSPLLPGRAAAPEYAPKHKPIKIIPALFNIRNDSTSTLTEIDNSCVIDPVSSNPTETEETITVVKAPTHLSPSDVVESKQQDSYSTNPTREVTSPSVTPAIERVSTKATPRPILPKLNLTMPPLIGESAASTAPSEPTSTTDIPSLTVLARSKSLRDLLPTSSDTLFQVGDEVDCLNSAPDSQEKNADDSAREALDVVQGLWQAGKVHDITWSALYIIKFADGTVRSNVHPHEVRKSTMRSNEFKVPKTEVKPRYSRRKLHAGDVVEVLNVGNDGKRSWPLGVVDSVNSDGTYKISYEGGGEELSKTRSELRLLPSSSELNQLGKSTNSMGSPIYDVSRKSEALRRTARSDVTGVGSKKRSSIASKQISILKKGDQVFGHVTLPNGKKRWFPGVIDTVYPDETFKLVYDDGEIQDKKLLSDIRKLRVLTMSGEDTNLRSYGGRLRGSRSAHNQSGNKHRRAQKGELLSQVAHALGEEVDGLFTLPNGKKRWFMARITGVHLDDTYKLNYYDGDVEDFKKAEEIRKAKIPRSFVHLESQLGNISSLNENSRRPSQHSMEAVNNRRSFTHSDYGDRSSLSVNDFSQNIVMVEELLGTYREDIAFSSDSFSEAQYSVRQPEPNFTVNEEIEGWHTQANGVTRWVPGVVRRVNPEGTYDIAYYDGYYESSKSPRDIRKLKVSASTSTGISIKSFTATPRTLKFHVGKEVDGLFKLPNGQYRWFPGKITGIHDDGSYSILYNDGDREYNKVESEIRPSKSASAATPTSTLFRETFNRKLSPKISNMPSEDSSNADSFKSTSSLLFNNIDALTISTTSPKYEVTSGKNFNYLGSSLSSDIGTSNLDSARYSLSHPDSPLLDLTLRDTRNRPPLSRFESEDKYHDASSTLSASPSRDQKYPPHMNFSKLAVAQNSNFGSQSSETNNVSPSKDSQSDVEEGRWSISVALGDSKGAVVGLKALCNELEEDSDDDSDNHVFTIQSVFGTHRKNDIYVDVRMNLSQINLSGALQRSAGLGSLSSSLLITEGAEFMRDDVNQDSHYDDDEDEDDEGSVLDNEDDEGDGYEDDEGDFDEGYYEGDGDEDDEIGSDDDYDDDDIHVVEVRQSVHFDVRPRLAIVDSSDYIPRESDNQNAANVATMLPPKGKANPTPAKSILNSPKASRLNIVTNPCSPAFRGAVSGRKSKPNSLKSPDGLGNEKSSIHASSRSEWVSTPGDETARDSNSSLRPSGGGGGGAETTLSTTFKPIITDLSSVPRQTMSPMPGARTPNEYNSARSNMESLLEKARESGQLEDESALTEALREYSTSIRQSSHGERLSLPLQNLLSNHEDSLTSKSFSRTFRMVVALLLRRCIVDKYFLDPACCSARQIANPRISSSGQEYEGRSGSGPGSRQNTDRSEYSARTAIAPLKHINLLFNIREYLELLQTDQFIPLFSEISNVLGASSVRLLKLLSENYFISCLPSHIETAEKIGGGGFGTIYRFTCPGYCSKSELSRLSMKAFYAQLVTSSKDDNNPYHLSNCSAWLQHNCACCKNTRKSSFADLDDVKARLSKPAVPSDHQYAVKRIPRERSVHDNQVICSIFDEVSSLECLSGTIGVCQLFDYGVHKGEYWIVMEAGGPNLNEWRRRNMDIGGYGPFKRFFRKELLAQQNSSSSGDYSPNWDEPMLTSRVKDEFNEFSDTVLSVKDTALCLAVFLDILYIVQSIHNADVAHFDLKCDNVVIKGRLNESDEVEPAISESKRLRQLSKKVADLSLDYNAFRFAHAFGRPSGRILIVDFGESMSQISSPKSRSSTKAAATRVRGTMAIQSPEILCLSNENNNKGANDRKKFPDPGKASDVWSLGCLLVEILTGNFLFAERQWVDLYVNFCKSDCITPQMLQLDHLRKSLSLSIEIVRESIINIVINTLKQLPEQRPKISQLIDWVSQILQDDMFTQFDDETTRESIYQSSSRGLATAQSSRIPINETFDEMSHDYVRLKETLAVASSGKLFLRLVDNMAKLDANYTSSVHSKTTNLHSPLLLTDDISPLHRVSLFQTVFSELEGKDKLDSNEIFLESNYSRMDSLLNTSDLSRLSKDLGCRVLQNNLRHRGMIQIIFVQDKIAYDATMRDAINNNFLSKVFLIMVDVSAPDQVNKFMKKVLEAFTICRNHLFEDNTVLVTVSSRSKVDTIYLPQPQTGNSLDGIADRIQFALMDKAFIQQVFSSMPPGESADTVDLSANPTANNMFRGVETTNQDSNDQEYSKLCVSVACCLVDCLTTWESLSKIIPELNSEDEYSAKFGGDIGQSSLSTSRAYRVRALLSQKVTESSLSDNMLRQSVGVKMSNKYSDMLIEMGCGSQGITSVAPILDQACCRRVSKIVADYLGRNVLFDH